MSRKTTVLAAVVLPMVAASVHAGLLDFVAAPFKFVHNVVNEVIVDPLEDLICDDDCIGEVPIFLGVDFDDFGKPSLRTSAPNPVPDDSSPPLVRDDSEKKPSLMNVISVVYWSINDDEPMRFSK